MFFGGHDDEDNDFNVSSTGGSKLASLFSSDEVRGEESKQSLTYTAPKQPKKSESSAPSSVSVLHAVAVHTFKLENQQYLTQGKLGAAILGNHESFTYQLLLYKGQQQHVALANISSNFTYNVQPNFYANFYDNKRECWSIRFDTEQASTDFARQVALSKANSAGAAILTTVIIQDLVPGQDEPLETGHSAEVKYTGWLLTNNTLGQMFDTNMTSQTGKKLKLGKGKVIKGWEEGLIGAKKGGRRLLVVPPSLAYGAQGVPQKIPPSATLVFDIYVIKTSQSSQSRESRSSTPVTSLSGGEESRHSKPTSSEALATAAQSISQSHQDDSVKARGASISEQLSQSPRSEKALLISRMAKMGTPMLPMQQAAPSSESENEDELSSRGRSVSGSPLRTASPKPTVKPRPSPPVPIAHADPIAMHPTQSVSLGTAQQHHQVALLQQQPYGLMGQAYPYPYNAPGTAPMFAPQGFPATAGAPLVAPSAVSTDSSHLPLLMAENRTQNSEMRITLGKISDRVDMVLAKLGDMKNQPSEQATYMESATLLQNIQRIVQENTKLKIETEEKNTKIVSLNDKISDLLQRNQKLLEDSNHWLEKRSDTFQLTSSQSQARVLSLEEEKSNLTTELSDALSKLTALQVQLQRKQAQQISKDDEQLNSQLEEQDHVISGLQQNIRSLRTDKKELIAKLDALQDQLQDLQSSKEAQEKSMERAQKKLAEEKRRAQEEMDDIRISCKDEVESLKQRLAKQKPSSSEQTDLDLLEKKWQEEREKLTKEIQQFKLTVRETNSEKEELIEKMQDLQSKYDNLSASMEVMKQGFEERLKSPESSTPDSTVVEAKLKKAMNGLYRGLQRDFQTEKSYTGTHALKLILSMIKLVTTAVLEESSEERTASESSPIATAHLSAEDKQHSVPENTPVASDIECDAAKPPTTETSQSVEEEKRTEDNQNGNPSEPSNDQNGIPIPKGTQLDPKGTLQQEVSSSPKSESSDDFRSTKHSALSSPDSMDVSDKKYVFFDKKSKSWKPQPPPPPLFDEDDEEDEDDWLK